MPEETLNRIEIEVSDQEIEGVPKQIDAPFLKVFSDRIDSDISRMIQQETKKETPDHNETQLIFWLKNNNFQGIIPQFQEESITLNELIAMSQDVEVLEEYLHAINIPKSIKTEIKKLLKNNEKNLIYPYNHAPKQNPTTSFKRQLAQSMIPNDKLSEYQLVHSVVSREIQKLAPSSRAISNSIATIKMKRENIDLMMTDLLRDVANDLGITKLDKELTQTFETEAQYAKLGIISGKEEYSRVSLSFRFDEDTYFIVGAIGFRQNEDNEDEVEFGVVLYQERWKENWQEVFNRWITFGNTAGEILSNSEVEKFAMWNLYQKLM